MEAGTQFAFGLGHVKWSPVRLRDTGNHVDHECNEPEREVQGIRQAAGNLLVHDLIQVQ